MTLPKRRLHAADLLHGEDHEFVVNLYLAVLRRWPDDAGYRHFMAQVANRPEHRVTALREIAGSEEARRAGALVEVPPLPLPGDPHRARDAMLDIRTEVLHNDIARLREAVALLSGVGGAEVADLQRELEAAETAGLRAEISAIRRELHAALADNAAPSPVAFQGALVASEVSPEVLALGLARGLVQLVDLHVHDRFGMLEARLSDIEAKLPPTSGPQL